MKRTVRLSAFETNSSSTHAFAYLDAAAYSEFKAGGKYILLYDARYDIYDHEFRELDYEDPSVKRFGQEYADFSERLIDEADLDAVVAGYVEESGYWGEDPRHGFLALCAADVDDGGHASGEWEKAINEHGYYSLEDFALVEDSRGGATIAAEFHD